VALGCGMYSAAEGHGKGSDEVINASLVVVRSQNVPE